MKTFIKRLIVKRINKLIAILCKDYGGRVVSQSTAPGWNVYVDIGSKRRVILRDATNEDLSEIALLVSWYVDIPFIKTPTRETGIVKMVRRNLMNEYNPHIV